MLLELTIRNIALIDNITIPFGPSLNVLTGETGAGKSIIVDSVCLALGGRADRDLIRNGTESASVQAVFDISNQPNAMELLREYGIDPGDSVITIGRELSVSGRNLCRICGVVCTLTQLRTLAALLMDMHGQHEHQRLLDSSTHMQFLDDCGDAAHRELLAQVREAYGRYSAAVKAYKSAGQEIAEAERTSDLLRFQLSEIDEVHPKKGEYEKISAKAVLYEHASVIADKLDAAYHYTYAGSGRASGAQEQLKKAADAIETIGQYDTRFMEMAMRLRDSYYAVQEMGLELQDLRESVDYDPAKMARIGDRLDELKKLMRKYGPEIDDVLAFRESIQKKLEHVENADADRELLEKKMREADEEYSKLCLLLRESRYTIAERFCAQVRAELVDLGMPKIRFEAKFAALNGKDRGADGADSMELMLSTNPGEPIKPMASIASGGELARIMLAFKTVQNNESGAGTMIFDEIDTGVSGKMAQAVGEKMARIGRNKQVLCVTHLPQIAALGEQQYLVEKEQEEEHTFTRVRLLDEKGRVAEIARLISGAGEEGEAEQYASRMLERAAKRRAEL